MRIVIGITGASGSIYGVKLLEQLREEKHLVISANAKKIIARETNYTLEGVKKHTHFYYENDDMECRLASGSFKFDAMVIVPCSLSTASKIATGVADNLITRAASICLKERRKLILVPRETPLSTVHLQNLAKLSTHAIILPATPAFYHAPKEVTQIVNFVVGKIMEQLGIAHELYRKWRKP